MKLNLLVFVTTSFFQFSNLNAQSTLSQYINNVQNVKLDYVFKVESTDNVLTLSGYKNNTFKKAQVTLAQGDVLGISKVNHIFSKPHSTSLSASLSTVPFKVRPGITGFSTNSTAGLKNLGINVDLVHWKLDRYFADSHKSTHKVYLGAWFAPSVEELDSVTTRGYLGKDDKSKQLFVSTALTINYTYNNLTFTFVPLGFDFGTSPTGNKWVYNGTRWWGFGIGVEPKFFGAILNK